MNLATDFYKNLRRPLKVLFILQYSKAKGVDIEMKVDIF